MNNIKIGKSSKFVAEYDKKKSKFSKLSKFDFYKKKLDEFFQKKHEFLKIGKDSKIVENCVWNITISQNVPFSPKNWWTFWRKMNNLKIAKDSKTVVECDWNITISQNVPFFPKNWWTFRKKNDYFKNR